MKCCRLLLVVTPLLSFAVHASTGTTAGTITFHGAVTRDTSPPSPTGTYDSRSLAAATSVLPLNDARGMLSSEVLDFFATYARYDAKLVSVTYK